MSQSRRVFVVEAGLNVVAGYGTAVLVQLAVFPHPTLVQNLKIGLIFTAASLARAYANRRVFERLATGVSAGAR